MKHEEKKLFGYSLRGVGHRMAMKKPKEYVQL